MCPARVFAKKMFSAANFSKNTSAAVSCSKVDPLTADAAWSQTELDGRIIAILFCASTATWHGHCL